MKRLLGLCAAAGVLIAVAAVSMSQDPTRSSPSGDLKIDIEEKNPWTNLRLNNDPREFRFAVVSDRTGGHRPKIFSKAIERLNLLQPEFVVSVGDLIEGYTEDKDKMAKEWKEFDGFVKQLQMPFFYIPGNHDIANPAQVKYWDANYGRKHYHFVYRNVLFLMLNSEDPKVKNGNLITDDQVAYTKKVLDSNKDVRWTFLFLHKPLWIESNLEKSNFLEVEKLLASRQYNVFAGHVHRYQKFVRQGQNYYMLATTGGGSKLRGVRYGEFDHITWVTCKKDGPIVANVMLDGLFNDSMQIGETEEPGVSTKNRKPLNPCSVHVTFEGKPVPNAVVAFHTYNEKDKKWSRIADGMTDSDGTVIMSTYTAFDGAPAGTYTATVTWQEPRFDASGKPTPNKLPAKYATPGKSPLTVKVAEKEKNLVQLKLEK